MNQPWFRTEPCDTFIASRSGGISTSGSDRANHTSWRSGTGEKPAGRVGGGGGEGGPPDTMVADQAAFLVEARTLATLRHPNLVGYLDSGLDEVTAHVRNQLHDPSW